MKIYIYIYIWRYNICFCFSVSFHFMTDRPSTCLQRTHFHSFNAYIILHCIYVALFLTHFAVDGHLGWFHVLSVVNSAVLNIGVLIPFQTMFFSSYMCRSHLQCEITGFDPWVGKLPWRRAWQPTPVFLPGESQWTEEPGGLQSRGCNESDMTKLSTAHAQE